MKKLLLATGFIVAEVFSVGCHEEATRQLKPIIGIEPIAIDFGIVKTGGTGEQTIRIASLGKTSISINSVSIEDVAADRGALAFEVGEVPTIIPELSEINVQVRFTPRSVVSYEAALVISSNDDETPLTRVALHGSGAKPAMEVVPGMIDFGAEPFARLLPSVALPSISIANQGEVELVVTKLAIEGVDASAFEFFGNAEIPDAGLVLKPNDGVNLSVKFKPTSETQSSYQAEVVVKGDDESNPEVRVKLMGTLRDNNPPTLCANIIRVKPSGGSAVSYDSKSDWDAVKPMPAEGRYDLTNSRPISPGSEVTFSAISDAIDETQCTTDPEDGRVGLTYSWQLTTAPDGAGLLQLANSTSSNATLRPLAIGTYTVQLTAADRQGHQTVATIIFEVANQEDLVAQLSWGGFPNVDLDVHLIRPSSAVFSFFEEGQNQNTSGDLNGYSASIQKNNPGYNYEWGEPGEQDDPQLNFDDSGKGQLLENVSLNSPEHDPVCSLGPCTYKLMVHYFRDDRSNGSAPTCTISLPSKDGDACDCPSGARCVADEAPAGTAPIGAGKCFTPPRPVLRIFFKGNPIPAQVIPIDPDVLFLPAPCQMLYVADIVWPQNGATGVEPRVSAKSEISRFGIRSSSSLSCSPNLTKTGAIPIPWYGSTPL